MVNIDSDEHAVRTTPDHYPSLRRSAVGLDFQKIIAATKIDGHDHPVVTNSAATPIQPMVEQSPEFTCTLASWPGIPAAPCIPGGALALNLLFALRLLLESSLFS